jgi:hypothetical protein
MKTSPFCSAQDPFKVVGSFSLYKNEYFYPHNFSSESG